MRKIVALLSMGIGLFLSTTSVRAVMLFADEFNDDILNPGWQINSVQGVDFLLTKEPGRLSIVNKGPETSITAGNAARLTLDAPAGDFTMEMHLTSGEGSCCADGGPGVYVTFNSRDTLAWYHNVSYDLAYLELYFENTQTAITEKGASYKYPLYMRMRRVSNNYILEVKQRPEDKWVGVKQTILNDVPIKIGIIFPKYDDDYTAGIGYFHLEAPAPDGPDPILSQISAATAQPGGILMLGGQNFSPGHSILLLNTTPVSALFSTATQSFFQVPLNVAAGTHNIAVQTGTKVSNALSFTVPSNEPVFAPLPIGGGLAGDANGDGKIDISDAVIVLRKAIGLQ